MFVRLNIRNEIHGKFMSRKHVRNEFFYLLGRHFYRMISDFGRKEVKNMLNNESFVIKMHQNEPNIKNERYLPNF